LNRRVGAFMILSPIRPSLDDTGMAPPSAGHCLNDCIGFVPFRPNFVHGIK
jgi:hypothetical protein